MNTMKAMRYIPIFLLFIISNSVSARQSAKVVKVLPGSAVMIATPTTPQVLNAEPWHIPITQMNTSTRITSYQNTVELLLKNHTAFDIDVKVNVNVKLEYFMIEGSAPVTKQLSLKIDFKTLELQKSRISDLFVFTNAYKAILTVTDMTCSSSTGISQNDLKLKLQDFIELDVSFQEEYFTRIDYNSLVTGLGSCTDPSTDELLIYWDPVYDAEEYELEYTFTDDYSASSSPMPPGLVFFDFRKNSTRIGLKETEYRFPLLFERGYILYRVRAIGRGGSSLNLPAFCKWSGLIDHGTANNFPDKFYHNAAHMQDNINWQVKSTFAEDGKRSDVIQYMDGTFRVRQTVTGANLDGNILSGQAIMFQLSGGTTSTNCDLLNTNKTREVIAGETVYDFQGRAAVNILPVPTNSLKIEYLSKLNLLNASTSTYNWADFDRPDYHCPDTKSLNPKPYNGIMGASGYYSAYNPNHLGFNAFIPDAEGYPFTQICYLPDNTGRVAAQTGVGPEFQFGKGHETRYYYASPDQAELDLIFGTEAGDAVRYKKNAVMDGNRQIAVTYINPEGKTVATALAGKPPDNLDPLDQLNTKTINVSLLDKNVTDSVDKTSITENQFFVSSDNSEYIFDYHIDPQILSAETCDEKKICLDCIYDIEISLTRTESCDNKKLFEYTGTIGKLLDDQGHVDLECQRGKIPIKSSGTVPGAGGPIIAPINTNSKFTTSSTLKNDYQKHFSLKLDVGTYTITKKITVNKQAATAYVDEAFKDTCMFVWKRFLKNELSHIDTMDCYNSCYKCSEPPVQTAECDTAYCDSMSNRCDIIRKMMLADVSKGGQYAEFKRNSDGSINAADYPLSIFNPLNELPGSPKLLPGRPTEKIICNEVHQQFPDCPYIPNSTNPGENYRLLIEHWKPQYAEALLQFHPEYLMLGWCDEKYVKQSLDYDKSMLSVYDFTNAVKQGYTSNSSPSDYMNLLNNDPLFKNSNTGIIGTCYSIILGRLQNVVCPGGTITPADEAAKMMAYCSPDPSPANVPGVTPSMNLTPSTCTFPPHPFGSIAAYADKEWHFLRSIYLSAKNEAIEKYLEVYAAQKQCDPYCIGSDDFYILHHWIGFLNNYAPCRKPDQFDWVLYKDKQPRFGPVMGEILKGWNDANIPVNVQNITNMSDPCNVSQALINQASTINHAYSQLANCDTVFDSCRIALQFLTLMNHCFESLLKQDTVTLGSQQLPPLIRNAGITSVTAYIAPPDVIRIIMKPCQGYFDIPFKKSGLIYIPPVSICCIRNLVCPNNANCSFDAMVTYADQNSARVHVQTPCPFLDECRNCPQPGPIAMGIKSYLDAFFQVYNTKTTKPTDVQMFNFMPAVLKIIEGTHASGATCNIGNDLIFYITYGIPLTDKTITCTITLLHNAVIGNWNKVVSVLSITPDLTGVLSSGLTKSFTIKVLYYGVIPNISLTAEIHGSVLCWPVNECLPESALCDTIRSKYILFHNDCPDRMIAKAYSNASLLYGHWIDSVKNDLLKRYYAKCLQAAEQFNMTYTLSQYHYTLYYYDQAGELVKTVPPAGVQLLDPAKLPDVATSRKNHYASPVLPNHIKPSLYCFNTLNQASCQQTPDAGVTRFWYDGLGRIVASQNAQQTIDNYFSYVRFDKLGRVVESGKLQGTGVPSHTRDFSGWNAFLDGPDVTDRREINLTQYDVCYTTQVNQKFGSGGQRNLRNRVASVFSFEDKSKLLSGYGFYSHATHYSYDIAGNVYKLIQDYPNGLIGDKTVEYEYDLQSGKVNKLIYQKNKPDQFIHKYKYDALNRLIKVQTGTTGITWENDALYYYYRHGPLARNQLGTDAVQGLDYLYTLQGYIKGVNGTTLKAEDDMGLDGIVTPAAQGGGSIQPEPVTIGGVTFMMYSGAMILGSTFNGPGYGALNNTVARDAFGYVLDYYKNDYKPIEQSVTATKCLDALSQRVGDVSDLYNGNISRMYTQIWDLGNCGFNYRYDQLNRLKSQSGWSLDGNAVMSRFNQDDYAMSLTYDPDGNIINLNRYGTVKNGHQIGMDNLKYFYKLQGGSYYDPASTLLASATNRLDYVHDNITSSGYAPADIECQSPGNYDYDAIGNMTKDISGKISSIEWNLQNKVKKITKDNATISFGYDAHGNRVMKDFTGTGSPNDNSRTFYVRDAKGNILSTYLYKSPASSGGTSAAAVLTWDEAYIYGISRIGMLKPEKVIPESPIVGGSPGGGLINIGTAELDENVGIRFGIGRKTKESVDSVYRGYRYYELSNHLGNVLVTITDRKLRHLTSNTFDNYYFADVLSKQDYYPFGMPMPERNISVTKYRFGFNGKENDNEVIENGGLQDYGFRMYDTRVCRFVSVDPLTKKYPDLTTYQFAGNTPIIGIDQEGLEVVALVGGLRGAFIVTVSDEVGILFDVQGFAFFNTTGVGIGPIGGLGVGGGVCVWPGMLKMETLAGWGWNGGWTTEVGVGVEVDVTAPTSDESNMGVQVSTGAGVIDGAFIEGNYTWITNKITWTQAVDFINKTLLPSNSKVQPDILFNQFKQYALNKIDEQISEKQNQIGEYEFSASRNEKMAEYIKSNLDPGTTKESQMEVAAKYSDIDREAKSKVSELKEEITKLKEQRKEVENMKQSTEPKSE